MRLIRGATTIECDCKEEIVDAISEMMHEIFERNALSKDEIRGFLFSVTTDIHSFHPAKAARECGYDYAPLFACVEPEIDNQLPFCIRVMVFAELQSDRTTIHHIYQKGARTLRKDITEIFNIALDGPAGSGKSTVAKMIAKDYNILYLDTGAMYRACGLKALRMGISPKDRESVDKIIDSLNVTVEYVDGAQRTLLDGEDVSLAIRENSVSMAASDISAHPSVREKMVELQRAIAQKMSCVLDGRDIGTVVLPMAKYKFFITADSKVRAQRRYDELLARGQSVDFDKLHAEIVLRDKQDSERATAPLKAADDAIIIDTSSMSIESVVNCIKSVVQSNI